MEKIKVRKGVGEARGGVAISRKVGRKGLWEEIAFEQNLEKGERVKETSGGRLSGGNSNYQSILWLKKGGQRDEIACPLSDGRGRAGPWTQRA